ncbi:MULTISPECIES: hypothetical protein [unclassified Moorena]|nr:MULTISPECIES: hypothetical protein [unclassified Moorena]
MRRWGDRESDQFSRFPIPDSRFPIPYTITLKPDMIRPYQLHGL